MRQIPRRYLSMSGLRVRSPNSDHDRPTVALPLATIEEIRIEDRDLRVAFGPGADGRKSPGWFSRGGHRGIRGYLVRSSCMTAMTAGSGTGRPDPGRYDRWGRRRPGVPDGRDRRRRSRRRGALTPWGGCCGPSPGRRTGAIAPAARVSDSSSGTEGMEPAPRVSLLTPPRPGGAAGARRHRLRRASHDPSGRPPSRLKTSPAAPATASPTTAPTRAGSAWRRPI